jgi:tRNA A-37 threonylcarbamoyl transferase component Bud32
MIADDGEVLGAYRVLRAIGAGGAARIDLARLDRAYGFHRHVVIKRALDHRRDHAEVTASLRREAKLGGRLRHPNLVAVLDAGVHDQHTFLVLEYVHGASLRTLVRRDVPGTVRALPIGVALAIVAAAARGLHAAHELTDDDGEPLGLVHRDVSPGNLLLGFDGAVKLTDFGSASETGAPRAAAAPGTVTYMAPEHGQGRVVDRRADVFSLGVILYELVTGVRPFWADSDVASLHRVLSGAVAPPRAHAPAIPGALEAIVMTAIAHAPEQRFADAGAFASALEGFAVTIGELLGPRVIARAMAEMLGDRPLPWVIGSDPVVPAPSEAGLERPVRGQRARRRRGFVAGALVLGALGGVALASFAGRHDDPVAHGTASVAPTRPPEIAAPPPPAPAEPAVALPPPPAPAIANKHRAPHRHVPAPAAAIPPAPAPAIAPPAPTAPTPPANVEWKPTLLLPSDGTAGPAAK